MYKLVPYLKPYIGAVILAVCFLFFQVNMELALPDLMSQIVNTGIQQQGVESEVPAYISKDTLDWLALLNEGSKEDVYSLFVDDSLMSEKEGKEILALDFVSDPLLFIDTDFTALWNKYSFLTNPALQKQIPSGNMPSGPELKAMLGNLPEEGRIGAVKRFSPLLDKIPGTLQKQTAIQAVINEYNKIGYDTAELQQRFVLKTGGLMLLYTLGSVLATIIVGFLAARISAGTARNIRGDLFERVESFTNAEFDKFSTASLITRSTNDITQVQHVIFMIIRMVVYAPLMGAGGVMRAYAKAPSMSWLIALAVLVLLGVIIILITKALPRFQLIQTLVDRLNLVSRENLSGMMVVRAFNRQSQEETRFDYVNSDLTHQNRFLMRLMAFMMPAIMLIMNVLTVAIVWVGAQKIAESSMQVGDMMAFLQYAMQIVMSFLMLSMLFIFLPRAAVSGKRIAEVLFTQASVCDPETPESLESSHKGVIEFHNVSFRYPGADEAAICNISFKAEPGKTTAFIGSTGAGKSTIVNLIPRFYDCSEGKITLDGLDIKTITQHELREQIAYVPQKSVLFSGTIRSNLQYADETADDKALRDSLVTARGEEILNKEKGLDETVSQGGANYSGGQKQRLAIARALVKKAPVLIFDDSFSALDFKTDKELRHELKEKASDKSLIIVAQRVSTIMNAEQIIVLDEGKTAGVGTHAELMKTCEAYREIVYSQIDEEELA